MTSTTAFMQLRQAKEEAESSKIRSVAKSRVQLDLTPRSMKILTELKEKTESSSYAEVIKNALKLYDGIITEVENGAEFLIRNKEGQVVPFRMFF